MMVVRIERGQRFYIADEPGRLFEGALLDVDIALGVVRLDPLSELTLDSSAHAWMRTPLPKGPPRSAPFSLVHDEENEAHHYAQRHYTSPLGDSGVWSHPSKRVWVLTTGQPANIPAAPAANPPAPVTVELFPTQARRRSAARSPSPAAPSN